MKLINSIRETVAQFLTALAALTEAVRSNTGAIAAQRIVLEETAAAARATQQSTAYLENAERHRREQQGQRSNF